MTAFSRSTRDITDVLGYEYHPVTIANFPQSNTWPTDQWVDHPPKKVMDDSRTIKMVPGIPNSAALPRFQNAYSVTIAGGGKSWRSWKSMEVSTIFFSLQSEKSIYRIRKKSSINHPAIGVAPLRKPQNMFNHWMLARLQLPLSGAQGAWEFWPRNGGELGVDQVRCRLR